MIAQVKISNGSYRKQPVNGIFELVKDWTEGKKGGFVTVVNDGSLDGSKKGANTRILVKQKDIEIIGEIAGTYHQPNGDSKVADEAPLYVETDEETIERITTTFAYIEKLAAAAQKNQITGLIISGPLSENENLREHFEGYAAWQRANLVGFVSDEIGDSEVRHTTSVLLQDSRWSPRRRLSNRPAQVRIATTSEIARVDQTPGAA